MAINITIENREHSFGKADLTITVPTLRQNDADISTAYTREEKGGRVVITPTAELRTALEPYPKLAPYILKYFTEKFLYPTVAPHPEIIFLDSTFDPETCVEVILFEVPQAFLA